VSATPIVVLSVRSADATRSGSDLGDDFVTALLLPELSPAPRPARPGGTPRVLGFEGSRSTRAPPPSGGSRGEPPDRARHPELLATNAGKPVTTADIARSGGARARP
jgi:hypothetical protein